MNLDYYRLGFLGLQILIAQEFLKVSGGDSSLPTFRMRRFPYPDWITNKGTDVPVPFIIMCLLFAFIYTFGEVLRSVAIEKETQIKVGLFHLWDVKF